MESSEITKRGEINTILDTSSVASIVGKWEWTCPHCGCLHHDPQYTKHAKYRKCGSCMGGVMVILPY